MPRHTDTLKTRVLELLSTASAQEVASLCSAAWLNDSIPGLSALSGCQQGSRHLEGDVATHTGLVVANLRSVAKRRLHRDADFVELLGALIHDLKKPETRVENSPGDVSFPGHEALASKVCSSIATTFGLSEEDTARLTFIVAHHGEANRFLKLDAETRTDLVRSPFATSLALLHEADALSLIREDGSRAEIFWSSLTSQSIDESYFEIPVDRRIYKSIKWNSYPQDVLPLWVADMDFKSPPAVIDALVKRAEHGEFGYEDSSKQLLSTIVKWCEEHYEWGISEGEIVPLPGLVCGLNAVCRAVGAPGDAAAIFTPVYPPFLSSPTNNGMETIQVPLTQVINKDSTFRYKIDFDAFERAITSRTKLCIFCHPHNPSGESWSVEDIRKVAEICTVHDIILCSDEIHCDLILDGSRHTPAAKAAPEFKNNLITLMAPSKTFNLPGLGYSFAIVQDDELRKKLKRVVDGPVPHPNAMGLAACEAAFSESEGWLRAVRQYITTNRDVAVSFIRENFPYFKVSSPERTYLLWIDCRALTGIDGSPASFFLKEARVALNDGALFGEAGKGFVRLNLGAPRSRILEALSLMKQAVDNLLKK